MTKTESRERFGWNAEDVVLTKRDGEEIVAAVNVDSDGEPHTGAMIALVPSEADLNRLALDGFEPREQIHLTLQFLGEAADIPAEARQILHDELTLLATQRDSVEGTAFAAAMFNPTGDDPCWVLTCGGEPLGELHLAAIAACGAASVEDWHQPEQHTPWLAHVTLAYTDDLTLVDQITERVGPILFDRIRLALGDEVMDFPFGNAQPQEDNMDEIQADADASHSLTETGAYSLLRQRFMERALASSSVRQDGGWTDMPRDDIITEVEDALAVGFEVSRTEVADGWAAWFAVAESGLECWFELDTDGTWTVMAGGHDHVAVVTLTNGFKIRLPGAVNMDDGKISVRFWAMGPMGPLSYSRRLDASTWRKARGNYGSKLSPALDGLMSMKPPKDGGRLMVWHGPPGTGKTHALRALAHEWSDWCDVDYIIDADAFFEHASYMVSALVMDEGLAEDRWRLVVIEDAGRYLLSNAQDEIGEGLGRLLNLADGLVGQGLRQLILMTTNEPAEQLHPAITRPGRCRSNLRFGPLTRNDANAWLKSHKIEQQVKGPATLAELYALSGGEVIQASARLPFAGVGGTMTDTLTASETKMKPEVTFTTARIRAVTLLDIPAFIEATIHLTGEPDADGMAPWEGTVTVEGIPTGDGRVYLADCFRWEDPGSGWPLRWDIEDDGMHLGSVVVGRVDTLARDGANIVGTGVVDTTLMYGMGAYEAMKRGMLSGVSVDMDDIPEESVEVSYAEEELVEVEDVEAAAVGEVGLPIAPEDTEWDAEAAHGRIVELATAASEDERPDVSVLMSGHLIVPDDADAADPGNYLLPFADVLDGVLTAVPAGLDWASAAAIALHDGDPPELTDDELEAVMLVLNDYYERLTSGDEDVVLIEGDLEASAWTQFYELPPLPASAFAEPDLAQEDEYVHVENGRIYGWVAQEGVCHDAFSGSCVTAPLGTVELSTFLRQPIRLDDGRTIQVGAFTMGAGHDNDGADAGSMRALFDDTRTVAGIVAVGVNENGMWFSGVAAPWLSEWDRHVFAACRPSGHWRRLRSGQWSLRAVLSVPTPGFPNRVSNVAASAVVNRSNMALAASAVVELESVALATSGRTLRTDDLDLIASAVADELDLRQRIKQEVEELTASLADERRIIAAGMSIDG